MTIGWTLKGAARKKVDRMWRSPEARQKFEAETGHTEEGSATYNSGFIEWALQSPKSLVSEGIEALREVEVAWLSEQLSSAISNLGYPVGCGIPPHPEHIKAAATALFDRYAKMIEMAASRASRT